MTSQSLGFGLCILYGSSITYDLVINISWIPNSDHAIWYPVYYVALSVFFLKPIESTIGHIKKEFVSSPCMSKTLAMRKVLIFALSINIIHIWFRSDSQVLVWAFSLNRRSTKLSEVLSDIDSVIFFLIVTLVTFFISHSWSLKKDYMSYPLNIICKVICIYSVITTFKLINKKKDDIIFENLT